MGGQIGASKGSVGGHEPFDLHQELLAAKIALEIQQAAGQQKRRVKDAANGLKVLWASEVDFEDGLESRFALERRRRALSTLDERAQVRDRFKGLRIHQVLVLALMPDNTGGSRNEQLGHGVRLAECGTGKRRAPRAVNLGVVVGVELARAAEVCGGMGARKKIDLKRSALCSHGCTGR